MNNAKADTWEAGLLNLLFLNAAFTNVGDAGGLLPSATAGSLYVGLHTADPGEAGDQTTNETAYTGYARVAVARSGAGWSLASTTISNVAAVVFGACTASPGAAITHASVGTASSGAGKLIYRVDLTASLTMVVNTVPTIAIGALTIAEL
jgi:hypothetical protein